MYSLPRVTRLRLGLFDLMTWTLVLPASETAQWCRLCVTALPADRWGTLPAINEWRMYPRACVQVKRGHSGQMRQWQQLVELGEYEYFTAIFAKFVSFSNVCKVLEVEGRVKVEIHWRCEGNVCTWFVGNFNSLYSRFYRVITEIRHHTFCYTLYMPIINRFLRKGKSKFWCIYICV